MLVTLTTSGLLQSKLELPQHVTHRGIPGNTVVTFPEQLQEDDDGGYGGAEAVLGEVPETRANDAETLLHYRALEDNALHFSQTLPTASP